MLEDIKNALPMGNPLEEVKSKNSNQSSNQAPENPTEKTRPLTPIETKG